MYKYITTLSELTVSGFCVVAACSVFSQTLTYYTYTCAHLFSAPFTFYLHVQKCTCMLHLHSVTAIPCTYNYTFSWLHACTSCTCSPRYMQCHVYFKLPVTSKSSPAFNFLTDYLPFSFLGIQSTGLEAIILSCVGWLGFFPAPANHLYLV